MSGAATTILVVDGSAAVRSLLSKIISDEPEMEMVGTAANASLAIREAAKLDPDVIVLELEMPVELGLETLAQLHRAHPQTSIIVFSTLTAQGARITLDALSKGAVDYATKPGNPGSSADAADLVRAELIVKIKSLVPSHETAIDIKMPAPAKLTKSPFASHRTINAVLIAASTGGPPALEQILCGFAAPLPVPILIVQHMPSSFTGALAHRLAKRCSFPVLEAVDGTVVEGGSCYLAPGGRHMKLAATLSGEVEVQINDGPKTKSCRPSADVMFDSARLVYGDRLVATVLTGMGEDGLDSCRRLADLGIEIIIQDQASSVVWGMPGAIANAGLAQRCLPLDKISSALTTAVALGHNSRVLTAGSGQRS